MSGHFTKRGEVGALWLLAMSAAIIAGLMIKREIGGWSGGEVRFDGARFEQNLLDVGDAVELAEPSASVRVVEFVDLECAACAQYHRDVVHPFLEELSSIGMNVSFRVVLFSLPMHPHAEIAAHAAECAHRQGRFGEFMRIAFATQREFAAEPWERLASDAGAADAPAFRSCLQEPTLPPLVAGGARLAETVGIRASPTVVVNGWVLPRPVSKDELRALVEALLDDQNPFR